MNEMITYLLAMGVLLGGIDLILGNKKGYGKCMEDGFLLMGPTALSMVGMICLIPLLSKFLQTIIVPIFHLANLDPSILGGFLAIDMGGYQLAKSLELDPSIGTYAGIVISATFGCTLVFTIPVGMGVIQIEDRSIFAKGILIGLITLPVGLLVGGVSCGLSVYTVIKESIPIFLLSIVLGIGLFKIPKAMMKGFEAFSFGIKLLINIGLILGAFTYLTKIEIVKGLAPIEEALGIVASIGITMLGSLPLAEFLRRLLKKPCLWLGNKFGMNETSIAGLLIGMVSVLPQITMVKDMDPLGKLVNISFAVCAASTFAAHIGFTMSEEPNAVTSLLLAKFVGAFVAAIVAIVVWKQQKKAGSENEG